MAMRNFVFVLITIGLILLASKSRAEKSKLSPAVVLLSSRAVKVNTTRRSESRIAGPKLSLKSFRTPF